MADLSKRGDELSGWKGISEFLGVSPRTAQDYERDLGLPVHRLDGKDKSRVWAYASELAGWKDRQAVVGKSTGDEAQQLQIISPAVPAAEVLPTRRHWLHRYGLLGTSAGALLISVGTVGAPKLWQNLHQPPNAYRIEGATLIVLGRDNVELFRHTFPEVMQDAYTSISWWMCAFQDLDGNGKTQTLFWYLPIGINGACLNCFEPSGRLRWQFVPGRKEVVDNLGRSFVPPYYPGRFEVIRSSSQPTKIVLTSVHQWSHANQVAVLDAKTGRLTAEYWHRGHLDCLAVADLDGDGEPEVLLGGVNDAPEYKQATVVVFDHRRIAGACRNPEGQVYFRGMSPGTEKLIVFFPKTPISQQQEFNRVADIRIGSGRITVVVVEGIAIESGAPGMVYEFDYGFRPTDAQMVGNLQQCYLELQTAGKLPKESPYAIAARLLRQVRVLRPGM